ncbi:hypothetical protein HG537_0D05850 [Torulaspora globosa]|uniref:Transcription factor VHR1 n=1 Tax=Torulaspora globosa TaxID=48254 RepID=A0A7H9HS69_9SACH|nr:hypothetical protein HG537_0D05850 [Torulaspora sp. CBS 2947]
MLGGGGGTTHKIREQLNFSDEKKWKQFSGRRLELIDKFGLSERKASEQDDNIKQIATILRTEFGYPISTASEFEKLVTAAVQSVRRNRKRSKRRLPNRSPSPSSLPSPVSSNQATVSASEEDLGTNSPPSVSRMVNNSGHVTMNNLTMIQPKALAVGVGGPRMSSCVAVVQSQQRYNDIVKGIISDLVSNAVPLAEQSQRDPSNGPNLTDFALSSNDQTLLSLGLHSDKPVGGNKASSDTNIPFFLREKLLLQIQRSGTCSKIAQGSIDMYSNLEILGEMSIKSSVAFVIERFFSNLMPSSMEYITSKTYSEESLALLSTKLFDAATRRKLSQLPAKEVQLKLLLLVMGGIVKDFGFDPCLYALSEVIHHLVMNQYPLLYNSENISSVPTNERTAVLSSLSMKPQVANQDVNKQVILKFKDREQLFTFHVLSNGPPTVNEILENSQSLFRIASKTKMLGLFHNGTLLSDDFQLAKLFISLSHDCIVLEVRVLDDRNSSPLDGLDILSTASLQVKKEKPTPPPTTKSSSVNLLDKIINKINKNPKGEMIDVPSVVGTGNKKFFQDGNLPQPVFQPLL